MAKRPRLKCNFVASSIALDTLDRYEAELLAEQKKLEVDRPLPPLPNPSTTS